MRAATSLLLLLASLSPAACSSLNQGVLDAGASDATADARLDGADARDVPAAPIDVVDASDVPSVDVVDASSVDAVDTPSVDVTDAPSPDVPDVLDVPAVDVVDAAAMDVVDASVRDVVDAATMDVVDAPSADRVDVPIMSDARTCGADVLVCMGVCVSDPASDPSHCGTCDNACPARAHATPTCAARVCGSRCDTGFGDCNGVAADGCETATSTSLLHCGACLNACPTRAHSVPQCLASACRNVCDAGYGDCNGVAIDGCETSLAANPDNCGECGSICVGSTGCAAGACVPIPTPRAIAPLSTSTVTSQSPIVRWINGPGATGAVIHYANNPTFTPGLTVAVPRGSSAQLGPLSAGTWYWYAQGVSGTATNTGAQISAVWEFIVGGSNAPVDNSFGTVSDFNRDGFGDLVAAAPDAATTTGTTPASTGRVRLYLGSAGALTPRSTFVGGGPETLNIATLRYGSAVASAGDINGDGFPDLLISGASTTVGQVFVHHGFGSGVVATPARVLGGSGATGFGRAISSAGDVNGDGYADVVVGAANGAYVFLGSATGLGTTAATFLSGVAGEDFGYSVASAGDVNADGYGDILVGAPNFSGGAGRFYLFIGSAAGVVMGPAHSISGMGHFGWSVAGAGDVNGDGFADVVVGAPDAMNRGTTTVYLGSRTFLREDIPVLNSIGMNLGQFGYSVAGVGDVDRDGYGDVLVGAPGAGTTGLAPGGAYLLRGFYAPMPGVGTATLSVSPVPPGDGARLGFAVSGIGDANGDGFMDFVVGAPCAPSAGSCASGRVYYYRGDSPVPTVNYDAVQTTDAAGSGFGGAVARLASTPRTRSANQPAAAPPLLIR